MQQALTNSLYVCSCLSPSQSSRGGKTCNEKQQQQINDAGKTPTNWSGYPENKTEKIPKTNSNIQMQLQIMSERVCAHDDDVHAMGDRDDTLRSKNSVFILLILY